MRRQKQQIRTLKNNFILRQIADIRRPLQGLIGTKDIYSFDRVDNQTLDYLDIVDHCSNHVVNLLNRLQFFSELSDSRLENLNQDFSLAETLDRVMYKVGLANPGRDLEIQFNIEKRFAGELYGSQLLFENLLSELVGNAVRFSPNKDCRVVMQMTPDPNYPILLTVSDQGPGIPDSILSPLKMDKEGNDFFFALGKNSGLGLAIVTEICRMTKAKMDVWTGTGSGSEIKIRFPKESLHPVADRAPTEIKESANRILIVEDEPIARNVMAAFMTRLGYEASYCTNGLEAIEICRKQEFGLILMDLEMPEMDGFTAAKNILDYSKRLPEHTVPIIVGLSATTNSARSAKANRLGFACLLAKPIGMEALDLLISRFGIKPFLETNKKIVRAKPNGLNLTANSDESAQWEDPNAGYAFSLNRFYHHYSEDLNLCQGVLKVSLEVLPELFNHLLDCHQNQDRAALKDSLHKLKGEFALLLADKGVELISRMESRRDIQSIDFLSDMEDLTKFVETLITEISLISQDLQIAA